ncbi:Aste57867_12376 [Aphanomyces stellatus]|uniref:beta-glucosidase n=1 Tax=Aphanomyces stellatus TaxID=120398 RepID=A0A485KW08_9STRA|nr:hypothetical protein As57867_012330 [Aphanomyces stellatus]VFT89228.1 Aste57867_12376 [Aphanomyces stellatus]
MQDVVCLPSHPAEPPICISPPSSPNMVSHASLVAVAVYAAAAVMGAPMAGDSNLDAQAKAIVDKMTVDQLLGEMSQIDLNSAAGDAKIEAFAKLGVGSYFNMLGMGRSGNRVVSSVPEWRKRLGEIQAIHSRVNNKMPMIFGIDSVHGATYVDRSVLFPQSINTAATFNPVLANDLGKYMARDTKAAGIPWMFGPTLDVTRHKHWPRVYETFGEDPVVVSHMGRNVISNVQAQGVAACFKHFITYSDPTSGLDRDNTEETQFEILNYFMPPFKAAIDQADVWSGMGSFIALNKIPIAANELIHKGLLRGDLGYDGLMVTDFREINLLVKQHHYVNTVVEAVEASMSKASYDMSMVVDDDSFIVSGKQLVASNKLPVQRIKDAVTRIMKLKLKLKLFETPVPGADVADSIGDAASQAAALAIAHESLVLLKNDNQTLPLAANASLFLTGSNSDSTGLLCGGWSLWWQGAYESAVFPIGGPVRAAMTTFFGGDDKYLFYQGFDVDGKMKNNDGKDQDIEAAKKMAAKSAYTVVVLGERPYAEYMGNDDKMPLPDGMKSYVQALKKTGTKIILVLVEGRPRTLNGLIELADAVIFAGLPCEMGGQAIVDVLFGKVNPSGKMAMTYPKNEEALNLATPYYKRTKTSCMKDGKASDCPVEAHFGDGLSYTTFAYSNATMSVSSLAFETATPITVSVVVRNTGAVAGMETVFLFVTPPVTRVNAETKLLKKYTKISLDAGEAKVVTFTLTYQDWGYYSSEIGKGLKKDAPSGTYTFFIKHDTDCVGNPSDALCLPLKWDNAAKTSFAPNITEVPPSVAPLKAVKPTTPTSSSHTSGSDADDKSSNTNNNAADGSSDGKKKVMPVGVIVAIVAGAICGIGAVALFVTRRQCRTNLIEVQMLENANDKIVIVGRRSSVGQQYKHL